MWLPRARFKVWQIMVAVAVVAVSLWVYHSILLMSQRHAQYRRKFEVYDHGSHFVRDTIWLNEKRIVVLRSRSDRDSRAAAEAYVSTECLKYLGQVAAFNERMKLKYESAMWCPWSVVEPDPPEPQPSPMLIKLERELQNAR
jgi:hypothetical protein